MNERLAIDKHHRHARFTSASTADEKKLAEVERAVTASQTELETEEREMRDGGKYTDGYIANHIANRKAQSLAYIDKLKTEIVEPIAKKIEAQAQASFVELPERTAAHIEASAHYAALDSDRRQEAISRAVTGKDDVLAVALLTGRDPLTDITLDHLMRRANPRNETHDKIEKIAHRVQATLTTIKGART